MATTTTITLAADAILIVQNSSTHINTIGGVAQGTINQVGSNVTEWAIDDTVVYNISNPKSYTIGTTTYAIVSSSDIYFKYSLSEA